MKPEEWDAFEMIAHGLGETEEFDESLAELLRRTVADVADQPGPEGAQHIVQGALTFIWQVPELGVDVAVMDLTVRCIQQMGAPIPDYIEIPDNYDWSWEALLKAAEHVANRIED